MSRDDLSYHSKASEILALISSNEFSTNYLWTRFSNSTVFCEGKKRDKINVKLEWAGLATTVMGSCSYCTQRKESHEWKIEPQTDTDVQSTIKNFVINHGVILSAYSFGSRYSLSKDLHLLISGLWVSVLSNGARKKWEGHCRK